MGTTTANPLKVIQCYNYKGEGHMARQYTWERVNSGTNTQALTTIAIFQIDDLGAFDSDCDEAPPANAILMAKLSAYDSDVLSGVPDYNNYQDNNVIDQSVQEM
ncbi:hypothetical protein Tco_1114368 [Tanacetum coccineum]|uniref:Uncharacterized protein n=1 Tax=Tanacetum coccineum TaxID=301880 RepID=A0ABQ5IWF8_9ASTR